MIRFRKVIKKALCDACGNPLSTRGQEGPDGKPRAAHYGKLINSFGFGSRLDDPESALSNLELCEDCYEKCFRALNLPESTYSVPSHLRVHLTAFWLDNDQPCGEKPEVRREIYHAPEWVCVFCDWKEGGRGYSLPVHQCETYKKVRKESLSICGLCRGEYDGVESIPAYAERCDGWVHHMKAGGDASDCAASALWVQDMRSEVRIDPKLLARIRADEEVRKTKKRGEERNT